MPPCEVSMKADETNGRWRLVGPDLQTKSVSWYKRGWELAAKEVLRHCWIWYTDSTGHKCPFGIEALSMAPAEVGALPSASSSSAGVR